MKHTKIQGFGLVEIVVATAMVSLFLFSILQAEIVAIKLLRHEKENLEATLIASEGLEAVRSVRDESWSTGIAPRTNGTTYYPVLSGGKWTLQTTNPGAINGRYTRTVTFSQVFRDGSDKISTSGTVDPNTKKITVLVSWLAPTSTQISLNAYLTNFQE